MDDVGCKKIKAGSRTSFFMFLSGQANRWIALRNSLYLDLNGIR